MQLSALGDRICVLGPSNSGKSTLADVLAQKLNVPAVHLDRLHHKPFTDWQPRPPGEFAELHAAAIATDRWVMDGNYSRFFPQRFQRATGIILLDVSTLTSVTRYLRRTLSNGPRIGGLDGGRDSVKLDMLHHIAVVQRKNRKRYAAICSTIGLPVLSLASAHAIDSIYAQWGLDRCARSSA